MRQLKIVVQPDSRREIALCVLKNLAAWVPRLTFSLPVNQLGLICHYSHTLLCLEPLTFVRYQKKCMEGPLGRPFSQEVKSRLWLLHNILPFYARKLELPCLCDEHFWNGPQTMLPNWMYQMPLKCLLTSSRTMALGVSLLAPMLMACRQRKGSFLITFFLAWTMEWQGVTWSSARWLALMAYSKLQSINANVSLSAVTAKCNCTTLIVIVLLSVAFIIFFFLSFSLVSYSFLYHTQAQTFT